jgi:hypothetical protein
MTTDFDHRYPGLKDAATPEPVIEMPLPKAKPGVIGLQAECPSCRYVSLITAAGTYTCKCGEWQFIVESRKVRA